MGSDMKWTKLELLMWFHIVGIGRVVRTDPCVCLRTHIDGLESPLFLAHAVDTGDIDRFFVLEKNGQILEFPPRAGDAAASPYLDISDRLPEDVLGSIAYTGLLGLTLHPNFARNWKIYVFYMQTISDQVFTVISEFTGKNKYQADPASERVLLKIPHPTKRNNGGHLFFGDDGFLYISVGDGGQEQEDFAQNRLSLLGKMLRIDVHGSASGQNYSIPPDNPYTDTLQSAHKEIYALGLRNSWRCSVDSGNVVTGEGKGRIFCGDVGEDDYEEVNIIVKGGNYGWNNREGMVCRPDKACQDMTREALPISVYQHTVSRAAVIGGYVYRGGDLPALDGQYIYGDVSSGEMFRLIEPDEKSRQWPSSVLAVCQPDRCPCDAREGSPRHILSFSADKRDELYILTTSSLVAKNSQAAIYKIVPPISPGLTVTCAGTTTTTCPVIVLIWFIACSWMQTD